MKELKDKNCWHLNTNIISPVDYKDFEISYPCIDLVSGIIFLNPEKKTLLTSKRTNFLISLISSGYFGASESKLIDDVYPEIIHYNEHIKDSLRDISSQLKRNGIKSHKKKDLYYYDFVKNPYSVIIPINLQTQGPLGYCKKTLTLFTADTLKKTLGIKTATAYLYMKDWLEADVIKKQKKVGKTYFYKFK